MATAVFAGVLATTGNASAGASTAMLGSIRIPSIALEAPLYWEAIPRFLALGPAHYADSVMPGTGHGVVAVAAHRVTPVAGRPYGPFRFIDQLRTGNSIFVSKRYRGRAMVFHYVVFRKMTVRPTATAWLEQDPPIETLVLSACTPPGSSKYRLLVFAHRVA